VLPSIILVVILCNRSMFYVVLFKLAIFAIIHVFHSVYIFILSNRLFWRWAPSPICIFHAFCVTTHALYVITHAARGESPNAHHTLIIKTCILVFSVLSFSFTVVILIRIIIITPLHPQSPMLPSVSFISGSLTQVTPKSLSHTSRRGR
jgi:hypothetical protein